MAAVISDVSILVLSMRAARVGDDGYDNNIGHVVPSISSGVSPIPIISLWVTMSSEMLRQPVWINFWVITLCPRAVISRANMPVTMLLPASVSIPVTKYTLSSYMMPIKC